MSHQTKRRLAILFGGTLFLTVAVSLFFLLRSGDASPKAVATPATDTSTPRVPVQVAETRLGPISATLSSSSTIEAEQKADVLAKVEGNVTMVSVREGDLVRAGQILATLEETEKKLALEKARLRLGKATAEYERAKLSFEQQLISRFDHEKAVIDRDLAASELETATLELDYTRVRAPFPGRVIEKAIVVGKAVKKGDLLFTLADFDSLIARVFLPEKDVFQLETGQPAELTLESKPDEKAGGRIRDISPVVDPKTGTVKVTVKVSSRSAAVRPGAFIRVNIVTDTHDRAILIPKVALLNENGEDFVYLAVDGKAVRRPVGLGYASNGVVEVVSGLGSGDRVVVAGHTALKENSPLEVLN